jgi:hypothetical protein
MQKYRRLLGSQALLILALTGYARSEFSSYLNIAWCVPVQKTSGVAVMDFQPWKFPATKYYRSAIGGGLGARFGVKRLGLGFLAADVAALWGPRPLTRVGQIVSDVSTSYTKGTRVSTQLYDVGLSWIYWRSKPQLLAPFVGLGVEFNIIGVSASGYTSESKSKTGLVLLAGTEIHYKYKVEREATTEPGIFIEVRYAPPLKTSTIPDLLRVNIGYQFGEYKSYR